MFAQESVAGLTVAAAKSGSGKTTITLALLAALQARGHAVQSYKVGPDILDLALHSLITGQNSYTLDAWLMGEHLCKQRFACSASTSSTSVSFAATVAATATASSPLSPTSVAAQSPSLRPVAVVEGVMGLFDGVFGGEECGSTAQMATWLQCPVLLVLDAASQGRSIAALAQGFVHFDEHLPFLGIVCNNVGSARHGQILEEALHKHLPDVPVFGLLPKNTQLTIPSRHLGLCTEAGQVFKEQFVPTLCQWIEKHVQIDALLTTLFTWHNAAQPKQEQNAEAAMITPNAEAALNNYLEVSSSVAPSSEISDVVTIPSAMSSSTTPSMTASSLIASSSGVSSVATPFVNTTSSQASAAPVIIAVAKDEAFWGDYQDNLEQLEQAGASLVYFSPLHDSHLPLGCQGILLGGGYPELHGAPLSHNASMLESMRAAAQKGLPIWAHGGGFMYLHKHITDMQGYTYPMVGLFPFSSVMHSRFQSLGYRTIQWSKDHAFWAGLSIKGHEFHYSGLVGSEQVSISVDESPFMQGVVQDAQHTTLSTGIYSPQQLPQVAGGYVHVYFASCPGFAAAFVNACAQPAGRFL